MDGEVQFGHLAATQSAGNNKLGIIALNNRKWLFSAMLEG